MSTDRIVQPEWTDLIGQRCLVRRPPPFGDEPIREVIVAQVTPAGYVRLGFVSNGAPPDVGGIPDWYAPTEWRVLEVLRGPDL